MAPIASSLPGQMASGGVIFTGTSEWKERVNLLHPRHRRSSVRLLLKKLHTHTIVQVMQYNVIMHSTALS